jgi:DNA polymerase eta
VSKALELCPDLILQHVATYKEGEENWAYREYAPKNIHSEKVSLDPYRRESRRIIKCIKESLPEECQRVEKASVDEVYMDLSAQVHSILLERYPELNEPPPDDDPSEYLPRPPTTVLDWAADALIGTGDEDGEEKDPDWDDVCLVIASEIVRDVRRQIKEELGYTCSGGVARNRMLAKLGSAYKKPNQQTVIRNRAVEHFLSEQRFTKIKGLGGKLGDAVVAMFGTDKVKDLLEQPVEQLKKLGDDTGTWIYETIRGHDYKEVNPRTQLQAMLSAKSFQPFINSFEQACKWLRIFAADIFSRCVEEGVLENKRRPTKLTLRHKGRQGGRESSKVVDIPKGRPLSEEMLFDLAKNILAKMVVSGQVWPCSNLSVSVGGWEDSVANNRGISDFFSRRDDMGLKDTRSMAVSSEPSRKRQRKGNIANFFGPEDGNKKDFDAARAVLKAHRESTRDEEADGDDRRGEIDAYKPVVHYDQQESEDIVHDDAPPSAQRPPREELFKQDPPCNILAQEKLDKFFCPRCNLHLPHPEKAEHDDFHVALDLSKELRKEVREDERNALSMLRTPGAEKPKRRRGRPPGSRSR